MTAPVGHWLFFLTAAAMAQPGPVLYDFEGGFDLASAKAYGTVIAMETKGGNTGLSIVPKDAAAWEGVTLAFPSKDLSTAQGVAMTIRNTGAQSVSVYAHVNEDNSWPSSAGYVIVEPGEVDTLYVHFHRNKVPTYIPTYLKGMNGLPGGYTEHWEIIDLTKVTQIQVLVFNPGTGRSFVVDDIRAWNAYAPPTEAQLQSGLFPLLDSLGQYRHRTWPGKSKDINDIFVQAENEADDLIEHRGPEGWNAYGGWAAGPKLEATGRFRTQKVEGKWWLVDPDGRLFWSIGITCVNSGETTPITGRENYFISPPANGDYRGANLNRKFGSTWYAKAGAMTHERFRSWGVNTFGNWSDKGIYGLKKTAYTVNFATGVPVTLPPDLDTGAFRAAVKTKVAALKTQIADDPWCLGVFSDNELNWPSATAGAIAEDYYRIVSQEMKASMPSVLYLGSRLHVAPEAVWRAAGRYCDVISTNRYEYAILELPLPSGVDKPVMLTEFHFGALDRGLPHPGLRTAFNQKQRARLYAGAVDHCLLHPNLVGAHWFQYSDQLYTGRGQDGENYQIGFVDICDRPYPEMVAAARRLSARLYA
ncbi:MAG: hypothetical protein M3Y08_20790, partial [Fibrobacterota bacterium]|nr:hypothetical protein [Fibrobacterota bacterium]